MPVRATLNAHSHVLENFQQLKSLYKWWKKFFISPQNIFWFSSHFDFFLDFLVMYKDGLIRQIKLISIFMTYQPVKQTVAIHILPNIFRIKCNQTMKFGQLIYNIRNIFLENHTQNMVEKLVPDPFLKNQNGTYLWIKILKFYIVCFYCMPSWGLSKYIETKL